MSHLHLQSSLRSGFRLSTLALSVGMALVSTSGFALEALNDEGLAESTGEGIAMLPEDFRMVFQGANDNVVSQATDYTDRTKDTGYVRLIPVGPLTTEATTSLAQKADIFLYGLAVSRADNSINNRYNSTASGKIKSWGSADNPWLLKVQSATVSDFSGVDKSLSYLSFEAPEYNIAGFTGANTTDDYHLKLGFWADLFMRDPKVAESGNAGLSNRLRLQAIWNDFSINGSSINIFQTLGGATDTGGLSTSYNNTLGMAGTLRFNSGDAGALRATISADSSSRTYSPVRGGTTQNPTDNWNPVTTPTAPTDGCDNNFGDLNCQYQFRNRTVTDTQTNTKWSLSPTLAAKALRLSTRGVAGESATQTPAINGTAAPAFDASEGLFMYGANFNLVLGSLAQPVVIGVAADGRNLNMEIARIANQANVYNKIYTDYANPLSTTYLGSTCNVYQCGRTVGGTFNPATHSSISIGSTNYDNSSSKNLLSAYQQADAIGVSFGALPTSYNQNGTFSKTYNEVQYQQRQGQSTQYVVTDRYRLYSLGGTRADPYLANRPHDASGVTGNAGSNYDFRWYNLQSEHNYWAYRTDDDTTDTAVFNDTAGRYKISTALDGVYCNTAYNCLGGTPMPGAGGYKDENGNWVGGASSTLTQERTNDWTTGWRDSGSMNTAMGAGFIAGKEDCFTGQNGTDCQGDGGATDAIRGLSSITDGYFRVTPNNANNANWAYSSTANNQYTTGNRAGLPWYNAINNQQATNLYNSLNYPKAGGGTLTADFIPTQITAVNPSPLNNLGSAVIDGLLIQHMKLTTKGL